MTELIFTVEESLEGGFEAKAMGANIFTQGDDLKDLKLQIKEAVGVISNLQIYLASSDYILLKKKYFQY